MLALAMQFLDEHDPELVRCEQIFKENVRKIELRYHENEANHTDARDKHMALERLTNEFSTDSAKYAAARQARRDLENKMRVAKN